MKTEPSVRWVVVLCVLLSVGGSGCRGSGRRAATQSRPDAFTQDMSRGHVKVFFTVKPPEVDMTSDVILSVEITAPAEISVSLPPIEDRLEGFVLNGVFDDEPRRVDGSLRQVRNYRLTPGLSERYRIAPMAITCTDRSTSPPTESWFPTRPIVLKRALLPGVEDETDIQPVLRPVWIHPAFRTVALYALGLLAAVLACVGAWKLLKRVKRKIALLRMSPRERALKELSMLLARDLPAKNRVKDFYLELTMIVRRYIERQHRVRAPEQTTEEFLRAAARHPEFSARVVARLKAFLEAADLVKFAAFQPDRSAIERSSQTAKEYIETDAPKDSPKPETETRNLKPET